MTGLPSGSINLTGPIVVGPAEREQGGWARSVIQNNVGLVPAQDELTRFAQPLDLLIAEPLSDDTFPLPVGQTRVKNPSVVFQVPITFTGSDVQYTGPDYNCGGPVCVPPYVSDGLYGTFMARVEDCLSDLHPSLLGMLGGDGNPIACDSADGIHGNQGYWYDIAPVWGATASLGPRFYGTQSISDTLKITAQLPAIANSIRIEFALGLTDTPGGAFINDLYWGDCFAPGGCAGPEWGLTRFAIQLPRVTVLPAALMQLKALPYTILYQPPGDQSSATFSVTRSFGVSMEIGKSTQIGTSTSVEDSLSVKDTDKVTLALNSLEVTDGQSHNNKAAWDDSTQFGVGLKVGSLTDVTYGDAVGAKNGGKDNLTPGSQEVLDANGKPVPKSGESYTWCAAPCVTQPFWSDRIVLLVNPQAAIWDLGGDAKVQLLGARSHFWAVTVHELDDCAHRSVAWQPNSAQDRQPLPSFSPEECQALASLDPFYGYGQSTDPSLSGRGLPLPGVINYGFPAGGGTPSSPNFGLKQLYTQARSTSGTATYAATVTDVIGFSWSSGLTLGASAGTLGGASVPKALDLGFTSNTTVTQGETTTTSASMKVTYQVSTVATVTDTTDATGVLADDHKFGPLGCQSTNNCYEPRAYVYLDELFGGLMFQDPDAPGPCTSTFCAATVSCAVNPAACTETGNRIPPVTGSGAGPAATGTPTSSSASASTGSGQASITTDKSQYHIGEPLHICYTVPSSPPVSTVTVIDTDANGHSQTLAGTASGGSGCLPGPLTASPPTGTECLSLSYTGSDPTNAKRACFQVLP